MWVDVIVTLDALVVILCTTSFNVHNFYILSKQCICVLTYVWVLEHATIITLFSTNLLVFVTETQCADCSVATAALNLRVIQATLLL